MVTGNGMIATRFNSYSANEKFVIFASGVSNSVTTNPAHFSREDELLRSVIEKNPDKTLVYFSTCSIYDHSMVQSPYVLHKLKMEETITATHPNFIIFRVSNPIGKTSNRHTVLNFFIQHILEKKPFAVWKYASRNLIDLDDMFSICDYILQHRLFPNRVINIANPVNYPVTMIVETIEKHFHTKGIYKLLQKGNSPLIDTTDIQYLFRKLDIDFNSTYLKKILQKYFPPK